jgi:hypothetical protein
MYRIRIFSSFCDSNNCKSVYERLCEVDKMDNYGPDKKIYIVGEDEPFTHAILMNTAMPQMNLPKQNVVGLAFEPPQFLLNSNSIYFIEYVNTNVSKYFIGKNADLPSSFIQSYAYMWHITPPRTIPNKDKMISIMVSDKTQAPGHQYRHSLVQAILKTKYPIDIYGRGCRYYSNDERLKGEFTNDEPYENYHFHICIENFQTPAYTSEKYTNSVLWGTTPIYWGATNPLFPEITIQLSGNIEQDMTLLLNITTNPIQYKKYFSQDEIRPSLNLLKNLDDIFSV